MQLPILAMMARRLLCSPATSAPVERLFSAAGLVLTKKRARLDDEVASALIVLHGSWDSVEAICKRMEKEKHPGFIGQWDKIACPPNAAEIRTASAKRAKLSSPVAVALLPPPTIERV